MSNSEGSTDLAGSTLTTGWINVSGFATGNINPYNDSDWFKAYLASGVTYSFSMYGPQLDAYVTIRDASGTSLGYLDKTGAGVAEAGTFTPTTTGVYYVDAQSFQSGPYNTGAYAIALSSNVADDYSADTSTTSTLTLSQARNGAIEVASDADWHRVVLTAGVAYEMAVIGGTLPNPQVALYDSNSNQIGAYAGGLTYTPTVSGTYYVEVSDQYLNNTGTYTVEARTLPKVSIATASVTEGNSGTKNMVFTLTLSDASPVTVSVQVNTKGETAVAGTDYQAIQQVVTFAAGSTTATVSVPIIGNTTFQPNRAFEVNLSNPANASVSGSGIAWGKIIDDDKPANLSLPTDPGYPFEWYLYTIRAEMAWQHATGVGIKIGVFDQGIDSTNPDLKANDNVALGRVALTMASGGAPVLSTDNHGTWVAGVIAAARDGQGVVGVAYGAQLVPIYTSSTFNNNYLTEIANAFTYAKSLDVLNNSWGFGNLLQSDTNWAFLDNANDPQFSPAFKALKDLATNGRNGMGTIVVQSAGNSYTYGDDTNLHNFQNSRYIITVGSTDYFGHASSFSTSGASILVSAPGGGGGGNYDSILTTDRTGSAGGTTSNFNFVDGTSFSAPVVSGVVALMLQANPNLGYRDVQQILAYTAHQVDTGKGSWDTNGATDWNGGGLHYNSADHSSGFGQVDALAAVRLAAAWNTVPQTVSNTKEVIASQNVNQVIPDNDPSGLTSSISITDPMTVERVDVTVNITHPFVGDLEIALASPSGTISLLLFRPSQGALSAFGSSQHDVHFTFDTVLDWGESASGKWSLVVFDAAAGDIGTLDSWTIDLIGKAASPDHTFIFTNEYPSIVAATPSRGVLADPSGGNDTINAGALGSNDRIDLSGKTPSILNGANLAIAPGTFIKNAIGGDGNDVLIANDSGSTLCGMGGNDTLNGGPGIDMAIYKAARSNYTLIKTSAGFTVSGGTDGSDTLTNIERLQFADTKVALDLDGNAGTVAKILGTVFGAISVSNKQYVGIGLNLLDGGMSSPDLIQLALNAKLGAGFSNAAEVKLLYQNLVGIEPSTADLNYWAGTLSSGQFSQVSLAGMATELNLNATNINLVGLHQTGIAYS